MVKRPPPKVPRESPPKAAPKAKVPATKPATKAKATPKPKRKPGEPKRGPLPWKPSPEDLAKIELYAGLGSTQDSVAVMLGKSSRTFRGNETAKEAFERGKAQTITKVAGALVSKALKGDTASAIFYLKTQAGWKETSRQEHTGADGKPIEYQNLSEDEVDARLAELARQHGPQRLAN